VDQNLRSIFNAHYSDDLYQRMHRLMDERLETESFQFRLAETPLFFTEELFDACERTAREITLQGMRPEIIAKCVDAIPPRFNVPNRTALPHLNAVDLAIVRDEEGRLVPRLVELQAFSSLYGMELFQAEVWAEVLGTIPGMPKRWSAFLSGMTRDDYVSLLRRTMLGDCDPEEVILLDIEPEKQKTRPDFHATAKILGIRMVCLSTLKKEGRRLFAPNRGKLVPVRRILNRVVFDELRRSHVSAPFSFQDDLDVTWIAHPDWYWVWSKYTLPLLDHEALPATYYLSGIDALPDDLEHFVLKPIFSFGGQGVEVDVTREMLLALPEERRGDYILQRKVDYAPALLAPDGTGVKAEVRVMFLRPDDADELLPVINLVRLSRGKMHGVDHNRGLAWVGSSVGIRPLDR